MQSETKQCQNCKEKFTIEPEDFEFYEKMKVPPPTFCPECRLQRRFMFKNERTLYKRSCGFCEKPIVTTFSPKSPYKVYCEPCWWSDKWGAKEYAMDYDPNRNFLEQFKELQKKVPYPALLNDYLFNKNSEYVNHTGYIKDGYLIFNAGYCENVLYSSILDQIKDSMDILSARELELCYQDINCQKCYQTFYSEDCNGCHDVYFSKNLGNCQNCFGCVDLKNKKYNFFNQQLAKEEYEKKVKEYTLGSFKILEKVKRESYDFWEKYPVKFMHGQMNQNVSGDYIYESKNAHSMYMARFVEDGKYCQLVTMAPCKDVMDYTEWGEGAELVYEGVTVGGGASNVRFSFACWLPNTINVEYSMFNRSCQNIFGCVGMSKKENCILNKQYNKEEYKKLRKKIIVSMNENPYVDKKGRKYKYGEFFPYDLSLFDYNETIANEFSPLSKEEIIERGLRFREPVRPDYEVTLPIDQIPDSIDEIEESILKEVLGCAECSRPFRLVKAELKLLKRFGFPVPRKCPDCRYLEQMSRINSPKLYHRTCQCAGKKSENGIYTNTGLSHQPHKDDQHCPNEFETSYSPDKKEIVYCEKCYQDEIV